MKEICDINAETLMQLLERQKASWSTVAANYAALDGIMTRRMQLPGCSVTVMHNPARILSTASKPDSGRTNAESCFLCAGRRPAEQEALPFGRYSVLVNPYPVFRRHFTIAALAHVAQRIAGRFGEMLQLARALNGFTVFYNGPECGASAPHHAHFQAGESGVMPIEDEWRSAAETVTVHRDGVVFRLPKCLRNAFVVESASAGFAERCFAAICGAAGGGNVTGEPMMNVLARYDGGKWCVFVFLRRAHRPSFYGTEGDGCMLVSPASVEMGGVLILPRREDFDRITGGIVEALYDEVCIDDAAAADIITRLKAWNV